MLIADSHVQVLNRLKNSSMIHAAMVYDCTVLMQLWLLHMFGMCQWRIYSSLPLVSVEYIYLIA